MFWPEIMLLIVSGVFVGFIDTLAGGGTIISRTLYLFSGSRGQDCHLHQRIVI